MKKVFLSAAVIIVALLVFTDSFVFAQNQFVLPSAGLTPESPFYFLDRLGETLRTFFTFNPEGKARLQIAFAAERVAEIKIILEAKGIEAKGLEVAQSHLQAHLANAATILADQKSKGKDVSALARELDDDFEGPKSALEKTFKEQERALEVQERELKQKILEARRRGDTAQVETLVQQLAEVKAQKELLDLKEEEAEKVFEREEERIEEEMEAKEEAEKAILEAEREKQEVLDEAAEADITVPDEAFGKFNDLLSQAKSAFAAGNYQEAKRLAKRAEKSLDAVEKTIEDLEEDKEKEEELKEGKEERGREVKEEEEELKREETEKEAERLEKEREKAKGQVLYRQRAVDWERLIPDIKVVLQQTFPERIFQDEIRIYTKGDITADGIPEALVSVGCGATTCELVLMRIENNKPVVARFKQKSGEISYLVFSEGAGGAGRYGSGTKLIESKNAIYFTHYSAYNEASDSCGAEAYQWNSQTKIFEFNVSLSNEVGQAYCSKVCSEIASKPDLSPSFQRICR